MKDTLKISRGDIYLYDFGESMNHIINGYRPVVILQSDRFNLNSPTVMAAPLTSSIKRTFLPYHIVVEEKYGLDKPSMILLEQQRAVDKEELKKYIGHIDDSSVYRSIKAGMRKLYGYADYSNGYDSNIRCLCSRCVKKYMNTPGMIVKRVDPFACIKEKCDQCDGLGFDYLVYDNDMNTRRHA